MQERPAKCSHGEQKRDLLYVEDVASGFVSLLESNVTGAVNIASGKSVMIKDVIIQVVQKIGRLDLVKFGELPSPTNDPSLLIADTRRLREEVRWVPRFSLDEGLTKTVEWWKKTMKL